MHPSRDLTRGALDTIKVIGGEQPVTPEGDDAPLVIPGNARPFEQVLLSLPVPAVIFSGGDGQIEFMLCPVGSFAEVEVRDLR